MTHSYDGLVQFLRARFDERERECDFAGEPGSWCDRSEGIHDESGFVMADLNAKRKIVDAYESLANDPDYWDRAWTFALQCLAVPYAEHPDCLEVYLPYGYFD